jgi:hypothetical protein
VGGCSLTTILNPSTQRVSHLIVVDEHSPYIKRLVPIDLIRKITSQSIFLNCTREMLSKTEQLEKVLVSPLNEYASHLVLKKGYL